MANDINSNVFNRLMEILLKNRKNLLLFIGLLSGFLSVLFMHANPATGFGYLAIMAICLILFDIKTITKFKASLTSVEMEKTVQEGQETIKGLRELALSLSNSTTSILATYGYLNVLTRENTNELKQDIERSLGQLGLEKQVDEAFRNWNKVMMWRYTRKILSLNDNEKENLGSNKNEYDRLKNGKLLDPPSYVEVKNFIERAGLDTQSRLDLIEDFKFFTETKVHRRREVFFAE